MGDQNQIEDETDHDRINPLDDPAEQQVLFAALDSFRQYRRQVHYNTTHVRRQNIYALPKRQWELLASPAFNILDHLSQIDDCIDINADLADAILDVGVQGLGLSNSSEPQIWHNKAKANDHNKAQSTVRQFYRDWSAEGFQREVKPIFGLVLSNLTKHNLPPSTQASILLPGTGLGRLLFELTYAGYHCTGNEISYHQIFASNFILNHAPGPNSFNIYPFANVFTNNLTNTPQLTSFTIPDVHSPTALATAAAEGKQIGTMNMSAGDFITSWSTPSSKSTFDAVVTVYFIDTAPNFFRYIETINHVLKPGGLWINLGPLLWHFDGRQPNPPQDHVSKEGVSTSEQAATAAIPNSIDNDPSNPKTNPLKDTGLGEPGSFELPFDLVLKLLEHHGFEVLQSKTDLDPDVYGRYISDGSSMGVNLYRCGWWVVRKAGIGRGGE